uniref:RRM domain-containing protein n=1 Tax=Fagus sylvatica TaxID=28930 RepID=A0A2N9IS09_FAGSY
MPWTKANAKPVEVEKSSEPEKPVESDEKVDLDEDNDPELKMRTRKRKHAELLALPPHGSEVYIAPFLYKAILDSGENKSFAFVTFRSAELASKAIDELNNTEFKDLRKVAMEVGPGVTAVELVKDAKNTNNKWGFAFVDYHNHVYAEYSRKKMMNQNFKLGDNAPTVSWADPKNADSSAASQVL